MSVTLPTPPRLAEWPPGLTEYLNLLVRQIELAFGQLATPTTYAVSNMDAAHTVRTIDPTAAALATTTNVLATLIRDLQNAGKLGG
jgi:hypothetical protein